MRASPPPAGRRTGSSTLVPPTLPSARQWALFFAQIILVALMDAGNDIFRGNIRPANSAEAMRHAHSVVSFESAHGFFLEPAWQSFFEHTRHILGLTVTWANVTQFTNTVYGFCHIFVTLAVAAWLYAAHRERFALVRNVTLITNALAVLAYEVYPMAPPRLTGGITINHHAFHFRDTMEHVIGSGKLNGVPIGYNAFSAMPSVHVAWALIMGASLVFLARHPLLRALGVIYPAVMVFTVVVTGNHYLMDAIGAATAVSLALVLALTYERVRHVGVTRHTPRSGASVEPSRTLSAA